MNYLNMDRQQIVTFTTLVREQNFKRAASVLGVSQPTVTLRIKSLEQILGTKLVQRNGSTIRLTADGEVAYDYMKRMLYFIQGGKDHVSGLPTGKKRMSISAIPSFSTYVFPWLLGGEHGVKEEMELTINTETSAEVLRSVLDGLSQLGILRGPVQHPKVKSRLLYNEKIVLALPSQHPLNKVNDILLDDILHENFITYSRRFWSLIETKYVEQGEQLKTNMYVDSEVTAKKMVSAGLGISFLPELSISNEKQQGILSTRNVLDFDINREAYLIYTNDENIDMVDQFYDWVQESVENVQTAV